VMFSWGVGTLGYIASGRLADRFGRKIVLAAYTVLGMIAVLTLNYMLSWTSVTLLQLFIPGTLIGISLGVSAIYITYTSEIYPSHLRTIGLGFSVAVGKVTAVFVPTVLGAVAQVSSVTLSLLLSTAIGLLMVPTILFGPETAGRKLEEITA
jgi:MFS transporter, putative metabolite:H+ symporter